MSKKILRNKRNLLLTVWVLASKKECEISKPNNQQERKFPP